MLAKLDTPEEKIDTLEARLEMKEMQLARLKARVGDPEDSGGSGASEGDVKALKDRIAELEASPSEAASTDGVALEEVQARAAELEAEAEKLRGEFKEKSKKLGVAEAAATGFEAELAQAREDASAAADEKSKDLEVAKARIAELESGALDGGADPTEGAQELQEKLAAVEKERDSLAGEMFDKNRLIETLQTQLDNAAGAAEPQPEAAAPGEDAPAPGPMAEPGPKLAPGPAKKVPSSRRARTMRFDAGPEGPEPSAPPSGEPEPAADGKAEDSGESDKPAGRPVLVAGLDGRRRAKCHAAMTEAGLIPVLVDAAVNALAQIDGRAVEAMVIDARFDDGGGREILKRLSLTRRLFPCVVLCDFDFPVNELPSLGRMKILTKPVEPDQLVAAVSTVLAAKG